MGVGADEIRSEARILAAADAYEAMIVDCWTVRGRRGGGAREGLERC